ncbi:hypothetical protein [Actinacidiphila yanglinensis]|uniref:hypothetical protein n=1 Tax=Actinacidiphila yanglinensis TaxID=310779 RepID=UPI001359B61D|nr:hypothetical protein [Actinacidiphila yanglinensis]
MRRQLWRPRLRLKITSAPPVPSTATAAAPAHSTCAEAPVCGRLGGVEVGVLGVVGGVLGWCDGWCDGWWLGW